MAPHPKLSPQKEREVALVYLCGVDTDKIKETYNVSDATIRTNIVGKRASQWNDPLVEHYRQTDGRNRDRNSAHLYLTFEERAVDTLPTELVDEKRDGTVFDLVDKCIYEPRMIKVIQMTALRGYASRESSYDRLLRAVFGYETIDEYYLVKKEALNALRAAYTPKGLLSLDDVFRGVTRNIFDKVREGGLGWGKIKKQVVKETLDTLTERERQVLGMRFGLDSYGPAKLPEQIGAKMGGISKERIKQIEAKALHKMRHPSRTQYLKPLMGFITDAELEANLEKVRYQQERAELKRELYPEVRTEIEQELKARTKSLTSEAASRQIDEIELSVRTANCLALLGIKTVGELMTRTECDLLRSQNFGRKSLKEIKEVLADMNLTLECGH